MYMLVWVRFGFACKSDPATHEPKISSIFIFGQILITKGQMNVQIILSQSGSCSKSSAG